MAWQPIETAPRDGREALLWKPGRKPYYDDEFGYVLAIMDMPPAWWAERNYTHWMPLPEPPAKEPKA